MTIKRPDYTVSVGSPAYWVEFAAYLKAAYLSWGNAEDRNHREEFFNAYIDAAVRTYEYYLDRVRERTYALQDRVNAELGLDLSFASLYAPKWLYIPPQAYDPSYYPPSYFDLQQMVADYLDPKN